MLDDLLDIFDRDDNDDGRRRDPNAPRKGGIRGFLSRLFGGDDDDNAYDRRGRYDDADDRDANDRGRGRYDSRRRNRDDDDGGWLDFGD